MASSSFNIHEVVESLAVGPETGSNITNGMLKLRKHGKLVIATANIKTISSPTAARIALFKIPVGWRPPEWTTAMYALHNVGNSPSYVESNLYIDTDGNLGQNFSNTFSGTLSATFVYESA